MTTAHEDQFKPDASQRDELLTECAMQIKPELWGYARQHKYKAVMFGWNEYAQRRKELINEPDDSEAPEWAEWKAQDADGEWVWHECMPGKYIDGWEKRGRFKTTNMGVIPAGHNWGSTLTEVNKLQYEPSDVAFSAESRLSDDRLQRDMVACACGDKYPANSYGAGFLDANDGVCQNCDIATHKESLTVEGKRSKYHREIKPGVWVDVYDVLNAWAVNNPALQHLIKKSLAPGQRGHKDLMTDLDDILVSAKRAKELEQ